MLLTLFVAELRVYLVRLTRSDLISRRVSLVNLGSELAVFQSSDNCGNSHFWRRVGISFLLDLSDLFSLTFYPKRFDNNLGRNLGRLNSLLLNLLSCYYGALVGFLVLIDLWVYLERGF